MLSFLVINILCEGSKLKKSDYHHGNLKEEFLKIALDFIHNQDVENLTLKILSDATGTSRSAIYRHFKSKDALMEEVIREGFREFDKATSPIFQDKNVPLVDRFYKASKAYINWAKANPNLYRLLFGKRYAHIREEILSIKSDDCDAFGSLKLAITEGQQKGIIKKGDPLNQSIIIWASLHGLSSLIIDGFMDVEAISDKLTDEIFKSLLAGIVSNKVKIISTIPFINTLVKPN